MAKDSFGPSSKSPKLSLSGASATTPAQAAPARRMLPLPELPAVDQMGVSYEWVPGVMVKSGFAMRDVMQGKLSNCHMLAAFAALAHTRPELLEKAMTQTQDGTYRVRLHQEDTTFGGFEVSPVEIDGRLPVRNGELTYGRARDLEVLWVPLLEKALAQQKGGYEAISSGGGAASFVLEALTGKPARFLKPSGFANAEDLYRQLFEAVLDKRPMVAGTHDKDQSHLFAGKSIYPWHSYTVVDVRKENGQALVTLRNPWGRGAPPGPGMEEGQFTLELGDFIRLFKGVTIG